MRDDRVLTTFSAKVGTPPPVPRPEPEIELVEDYGTFGSVRGARDRVLMLELRHRDGNVTALGYAWLERCEFDASEGITLKFVGQSVRIVGRNLNAEVRQNVKLFEALCRHRIAWIQEADRPTALSASRDAVVIERLVIE